MSESIKVEEVKPNLILNVGFAKVVVENTAETSDRW